MICINKKLFFIDKDTDLHCERVEKLIKEFIKDHPGQFNLEESLIIAARIHDIGKNKIPDNILNAPRTLTIDERKIIDEHSYYSYLMAKEAGYPETVCQLVLLHHGLDKPHCNEISINKELLKHAEVLKVFDAYDEILNIKKHADLLRIIDAYDALLNPRVYKRAKTEEEVLSLLKDSPNDFPANIVDMLEKWNKRKVIEKAFREKDPYYSYINVDVNGIELFKNIPILEIEIGKRRQQQYTLNEEYNYG